MASSQGDFIIDIGGSGDDKSTSSSEDISIHDTHEDSIAQQSLVSVVVCDNSKGENNPPSASNVEIPTIISINPCHRSLVEEGVDPTTSGASQNPSTSGGFSQDLSLSPTGDSSTTTAPNTRRKRYSACAFTVQASGRFKSFIEEIPMKTIKEANPISADENIDAISPPVGGEHCVKNLDITKGKTETTENVNENLPIITTPIVMNAVIINPGINEGAEGSESEADGERDESRNGAEVAEGDGFGSENTEDEENPTHEENLTRWQRFCKWQPDDNHLIFEWIRYSKLPGIKEIAKRQANKCYRCTWFTIVTICAILGTILTYFTIQKYLGHPLVITTRAKEVNVDDIALPTIHATTSDSFKESALQEAFNIYKQSQKKEFVYATGWTPQYAAKLLYFIDHICNTVSHIANKYLKSEPDPKSTIRGRVTTKNVHMVDDPNDDFGQEEIIPILQQGMVNCSQMVSHCVLPGNLMECRKIIVSTMTNMGMACSFNRMPYRARRKGETMLTALSTDHEQTSINIWKEYNPFKLNFRYQMSVLTVKYRGTSFEGNNFKNGKISSAIPMTQGSQGGKESGLSVVLRYPRDMTCPQTDSQGFLIQLTAPNEQPNLRNFGIAIPLNHEARVAIFPEVTVADESVRSINKFDRGCFFSDEKELDFFHSYTQANCFDECLSKKIKAKCGCTLLHNTQSPGAELCTPVNAECVKNVTAEIYKEGIEKVCSECYQDCEKIVYRYQVTLTPFSKDSPPQLGIDMDGNEIKKDEQFAMVHYFWGTSVVTVFELARKWDLAETLSLIGGALGLTNGFTVLDGFKIPLGYFYAVVGSSAIFYGIKRHNDKKKTARSKRNWKQLMKKIADKNIRTTRKWKLMIKAMSTLEMRVQTLQEQQQQNINGDENLTEVLAVDPAPPANPNPLTPGRSIRRRRGIRSAPMTGNSLVAPPRRMV